MEDAPFCGQAEKLCSIIEKWNLMQYDAANAGTTEVLRTDCCG